MCAVSVGRRLSVSPAEAVSSASPVLPMLRTELFPRCLQVRQLLPGEPAEDVAGRRDAAGASLCDAHSLQYCVFLVCAQLRFILTQTSVINVLLEKLPEFMLDRSVVVDD